MTLIYDKINTSIPQSTYFFFFFNEKWKMVKLRDNIAEKTHYYDIILSALNSTRLRKIIMQKGLNGMYSIVYLLVVRFSGRPENKFLMKNKIKNKK